MYRLQLLPVHSLRQVEYMALVLLRPSISVGERCRDSNLEEQS